MRSGWPTAATSWCSAATAARGGRPISPPIPTFAGFSLAGEAAPRHHGAQPSNREILVMTGPITRRAILAGIGAAAALKLRPAGAQAPAITLGTLTPLSGSGGQYGPSMRDAVAAVIEQVN